MTEIIHAPQTAMATKSAYTPEQIELLKRTIAHGTTDDEFALLLATAQRLDLDPFARQIFAVKRWDSRAQREVMAIQISIDGYRLIAEKTGCYAPGEATTYDVDKKGALVSATATVRKFVQNTWLSVSETAFYSEQVQTKKDGTPNSMWASMPRVMLAKCAEAKALRRAFPAKFEGLGIDAEQFASADATPIDEDRRSTLAGLIREAPSLEALTDIASQMEGLGEREKQELRVQWAAKRRELMQRQQRALAAPTEEPRA